MAFRADHANRVRTIYKTILRLHRGLPSELSELGNAYTRDEFKRHMKCSPPEAEVFIAEWTRYALILAEQLGLKGSKSGSRLGHNFTEDFFEEFREDQIVQLYELKLAASGEGEDSSENTKNKL